MPYLSLPLLSLLSSGTLTLSRMELMPPPPCRTMPSMQAVPELADASVCSAASCSPSPPAESAPEGRSRRIRHRLPAPAAPLTGTIPVDLVLPVPCRSLQRIAGELLVLTGISSLPCPLCSAARAEGHRRPPLAMVAAGQPVTIWFNAPPPCSSPPPLPSSTFFRE